MIAALAGVPAALVLGLGLFVRARDFAAASPRSLRRRAKRRVRAGLRRARKLADGEPDEAARELVAVLFAWAEIAIGKSPRALQRSELRRLLDEATGAAPVAARFVELLDRAEAARYAGTADAGGVDALVNDAAQLLDLQGDGR